MEYTLHNHAPFPRYRGYLSVVSEEGSEKATVTVFDVQNKFIAFSAPIKPVMGVVAEWGTILMITQVKCCIHLFYISFCRMGVFINCRKRTPK